MSLADMPVVTVEQIVRFREAALKVEKQRDELISALEYYKDAVGGGYYELEDDGLTARNALEKVEASK